MSNELSVYLPVSNITNFMNLLQRRGLRSNGLVYSMGALGAVSLIAVSLFFATRSALPATSELAFQERSLLGKHIGSVIPASCDSVPPVSHFEGDCEPIVNLGVGTDLGSFVDISMTLSSTTAAYNEQSTLAWTTTGYTNCALSQDDGSGATVITPSAPGLNQNTFNLPYINNSGEEKIVTYSLLCTNPPHKSDVKAVRVWYAALPLFPCPGSINTITGRTLGKMSPDPSGTLPNGHPYCTYIMNDGDPHVASYDRVLGRAIMFGFKINPGMISAQSGTLTITPPSFTEYVDFGVVWDSDCNENVHDYYSRRAYCNERRFVGVANTADMMPDLYNPSSVDPQYTRFNCQFNEGWWMLYCTPYDGNDPDYIPPDPCVEDPYQYGCPGYVSP